MLLAAMVGDARKFNARPAARQAEPCRKCLRLMPDIGDFLIFY
jgi:hypothetical protein